MKRSMLARGLLFGALLAAQGCVFTEPCPSGHREGLVDARYEGALALGESASINGYPISGPVAVEVDADESRVIVRFDSEGRAVEQIFDVVRTQESHF